MDKAQKRRFRPEGLLLGALALLAAVLCIVYFRQIAQAVGLFADYLSRGFIRRALVAGLSVPPIIIFSAFFTLQLIACGIVTYLLKAKGEKLFTAVGE